MLYIHSIYTIYRYIFPTHTYVCMKCITTSTYILFLPLFSRYDKYTECLLTFKKINTSSKQIHTVGEGKLHFGAPSRGVF